MRTLLTFAVCLIGATVAADDAIETTQDVAGEAQAAQQQTAETDAAETAQSAGETKDNRSSDADGESIPYDAETMPLHEHPTLQKMLKRNNAMRKLLGLRPHRINPELTRAAQDHAWYMARTGNFSHESNLGPAGRARKFGYRGLVRENIAWNHRGVKSVFQGWQQSSGHWANIISPTVDAGFGYAIAADGSTYWVGMYGD